MTANDGGVRLDLEEFELANGLRAIVLPDRTRSAVAVHVMYHVGSKDERPGRTGFAHLFEHLLFQGSEHVAGAEHFRLIQEAGGTLNGTTWFDRTNYFETVPSNQLELALWLESDRMGWFLPAITQQKLDNQREVVKNERRQSYENQPYGLAIETVLRTALPNGHPYRHPTIGYMGDLDRATLEDVTDFFRQWYGPGNAVLVLCGDVDPVEARDLVERYFGDVEPTEVPERASVARVGGRGELRGTITDRVAVPRVYMMYHAPRYGAADHEAAVVLASVLAGGRSSLLYRTLVYERRIAADVHAYVWPLERLGMLWIVATARPGVSASMLEAGIDAVLAVIPSSRADEAVDGARNRIRRQLLYGLDRVGGRADAVAHAATLLDDPAHVNTAFARYGAVEPSQVRALAAERLHRDNRTVLHVVPRDDGDRAAADQGGRP